MELARTTFPPTSLKETDVLIIGQGIAGTSLAIRLEERGIDFLVLDRGDGRGASRAAAALVQALVFKRLNLAWPGIPALNSAMDFYRSHGKEQWKEIPIYRKLGTEAEAQRWRELRDSEDYAGILGEIDHDSGLARLLQGGWINAAAFLDRLQSELLAKGCYHKAIVGARELELGGKVDSRSFLRLPGGRRVSFRRLVLCTGIQDLHAGLVAPDLAASDLAASDLAASDLAASDLAAPDLAAPDLGGKEKPGPLERYARLSYYGVKGQTADFKLEGLSTPGILLGPAAIIPLGRDGLYRVGSTYTREWQDAEPEQEGIIELSELLARTLGLSDSADLAKKVEAVRAGIRPASRDRRPYMGILDPEYPQVYAYNGLGTRGFLSAPYLSGILAEHLATGSPLPEDLAPRWKG